MNGSVLIVIIIIGGVIGMRLINSYRLKINQENLANQKTRLEGRKGQIDAQIAEFKAKVAELEARKAELVDYRTSGNVTGNFDSVVGYAGLRVM